MPWLTLWVDPVPFTTHRGVMIYHTYNDMEARAGFHRYRFTTSASDADARFHFDVRALHGPKAARLRHSGEVMEPDAEHALIREIIHEAIDCRYLRQNGFAGRIPHFSMRKRAHPA